MLILVAISKPRARVVDAVVAFQHTSTRRVLVLPALGRSPNAGTVTRDPTVAEAQVHQHQDLRSLRMGHHRAHQVNRTCSGRTAV